jgi:hypothetical protein
MARVWNATKNFFWRTYRKKGIWLSESSLKRYINGKFAFFCWFDKNFRNGCQTNKTLHSQSIQAIVEKFCDNLKSAHSLRKDKKDIRYPYKNKGWFCVHMFVFWIVDYPKNKKLEKERYQSRRSLYLSF